jgi:glycosyltransferase involved in cell wall biosynthesis
MPDNLRVRMFSSEYPPCWGGIGKHVQNLCRRLQKQTRLQLTTVTYRKPDECFAVENLAKVRVNNYPLLLAQYMASLKLQRHNGEQLSHIHIPHAFLPNGDGRIATTFHVVWAEYSRVLGNQRPLSLFDLQFPRLNRRLIETERELAQRSDAIIAVSESVRAQLIAHYDVNPKKVQVIPNGVNVDEYRPSSSRENIILFIGRHTAHKGIPYLLEAFASFAKENKDHRLILVGERQEGGVDSSLVNYSRALGIADRVDFAGWLPDAKVRRMLGQAKCLVLPSLAESFGMVILEAMASRTPVIATNVGGIPDLVRDGHNGLLVPPASSEALTGAIGRIVNDSGLQEALAEEAWKTCNDFTWDKVAEKTLLVYQSIN